MKELNILIVGETGVGKSTWINGIVNYLYYESLEEAEKGELISAIGTSFSFQSDDYENRTVSTGSDDNEDYTAGQSATQYPKSYTFPMGDTLVRLIDTPGIGDVRGIAQHKINFQMILDHVSMLNELHGVCILLKANNARLTFGFQFCIKELLTHLHRDLAKNIVFCFTNSRGTFYRPGDTLEPLERLLQENKDVDIPLSKETMYCMDNEAFRFLAAVKSGIKFSDKDRINFSESWDKSVEETKRLLNYIKSLPPHSTQDTLSLNRARRLVTELTKPLADMSQNIQANIAMLNSKKVEFETIDKDRKDLSQLLLIPTVVLVSEPLNRPMTVCGSAKCIAVNVTDYDSSGVDYKQVCHDGCSRPGVATGTKNQWALMRCSAMKVSGAIFGLFCRHCSCPWYEHMHLTYKITQVKKMVEDATVKSLLNEKYRNLQAINAAVKRLEAKREALEGEQREIIRFSSIFAAFLRQNAITPYNDVMTEYLDHLIEVEKMKVGMGNSRSVLEGLYYFKSCYDEEVKIIKKTIDCSPHDKEEISPQMIDDLVKTLWELKETGPQIQQIMTVANASDRSLVARQDTSMDLLWNVKSKRKGFKLGRIWKNSLVNPANW